MGSILDFLERFERRYTYRIPVAIVLTCVLMIGVGAWGVVTDFGEEAEEVLDPLALPGDDEPQEDESGQEAEEEETPEPEDAEASEQAAPSQDTGPQSGPTAQEGQAQAQAPPPPPEQICPQGLDEGICTGVTENTIRVGIHTAASQCGVPLPDTTDEDEAEAEDWIRYINEIEGGVHGRLLEWYEADDGYCPEMAGEGARELIDEHRVFSVQGYLGVDQNRTVAEHAERRGVPYLAGGGPQDWANHWEVFHQSQSNYEHMYSQVLRFIVSPDGLDMADATIGMMYADTPDVEDPTMRSFQRVPEAGVEVAIPIEGIQQDFSSEIREMREAGVEVVYCNCHPLNTVAFVQQADAQLWHPQYTFVSQGHDLDIILRLFGNQSTWKENAEGLSNFCHPSHPCHEPYVDKLRQVNPDVVVSQVSLVGIHAIELWADPMRQIGPDLNRPRYMEVLRSLQGWTTGLTGEVNLAEDRTLGATQFAKYVSPTPDAREYQMVDVNGRAYSRF